MWKVCVCNVFVVGGKFPPPLFAFFVVLPRNGLFCAHVSLKVDGAISCTFVCVRVICVR